MDVAMLERTDHSKAKADRKGTSAGSRAQPVGISEEDLDDWRIHYRAQALHRASEGDVSAEREIDEDGTGFGTLSNVDARRWYLEQEAKIPGLIDRSLSLEKQARQAFELRNQYRTQARELMADRELAKSLYESDPNLTWDEIIEKQINKGLSGEDIYKAIIASSQRSRTSVNQSLGLE